MNKFSYGVACMLLLFSQQTFSQSSTNSPYSYFGLGEIESGDIGRTSGMGGIGIGMGSDRMLNKNNPASYSTLDSLAFLFDITLSLKSADYTNYKGSFSTLNAGLKKLAIGFRVTPIWSTTVGIKPFSSVGYKVNQVKRIEGSMGTYTVTSTGDGGLSQLYFGNSLKVTNHLSAGVNTSFIFGSIKKLEVYQSSIMDDYTIERKISPMALYVDFGLQYRNALNSRWSYTVGAVGGVKRKMGFTELTTVSTSIISTTDDSTTILTQEYIPAFLGIGTAIKSLNWTFGADFRTDFWGNVTESTGRHIYKNSNKVAIGAEYAPNIGLTKNIFQRMVYQAGVKYEESYLKLNSTNLDGYAVTAGVEIPGRRTRTSLGLALEYGKRGSLQNGLIRENYFQLNLHLNMSDIWFVKPRYQ